MKNNNTPTRQPCRQAYPTDLTDAQWAVIEPLFAGMRTYKWSKRELVDAVLYLVDSGCKWRELPHDFPPGFTVHSFYRRARLSGLWERIMDALVAETRRRAGTCCGVANGGECQRQQMRGADGQAGGRQTSGAVRVLLRHGTTR